MASDEAAAARAEANKLQGKITKEWQNFATTLGRHAYKDLMDYIDSTRALYVKYAEDRAMPHPSEAGKYVSLDNDTIAALLQNSRGLSIVKTYIANRVESGVAQPIKKSK